MLKPTLQYFLTEIKREWVNSGKRKRITREGKRKRVGIKTKLKKNFKYWVKRIASFRIQKSGNASDLR